MAMANADLKLINYPDLKLRTGGNISKLFRLFK